MMPWLETQRQKRPEALACIFEGEAHTYAELAVIVEERAASLAALGVGPGNRVGLLGRNGMDWVVAAHAVFWRGATLVPLHWRGTAEELQSQVDRAELDLLIAEPDHLALPHRVLTTSIEPSPDALPDAACPPEASDPDGILTILFTSGSSGRSKAVPLTVNNHLASAHASRARLDSHYDDRWLCCLPLCHIGGLAIVLRSAIYGTSFVLTRDFDTARVTSLLEETPITIASFVPTMVRRLLEAHPAPFDTALRAILVGGGPIHPNDLREARRRGLPVLPTYGMTEASSQIATLPLEAAADDTVLDRLGTATRPLEGVTLRIEDIDGTPCPAGKAGVIWVRGPMVTSGYLGEEDRSTDADGWFCTGDVGILDAQGFLTIDHRDGTRIVTGGENVDPREVEGVLRAANGVAEAVVVGIDDDVWGQIVAAAIVLQTPSTAETSKKVFATLESHCRARLASFKLPRRWLILDELPMTATGKIHRHALRERFGATEDSACRDTLRAP